MKFLFSVHILLSSCQGDLVGDVQGENALVYIPKLLFSVHILLPPCQGDIGDTAREIIHLYMFLSFCFQ